MVEIPVGSRVSSRKVALVDNDDAALVGRFKWLLCQAHDFTYAQAYAGGQEVILMHRLITGVKPGQRVYHRDRNGLNNQRSNLYVRSNKPVLSGAEGEDLCPDGPLGMTEAFEDYLSRHKPKIWGESALCLALLESALRDVRRWAAHPSASNYTKKERVKAWALAREPFKSGGVYFLSFDLCCQALGINPDFYATGILALIARAEGKRD